jgi:hypothetical protein
MLRNGKRHGGVRLQQSPRLHERAPHDRVDDGPPDQRRSGALVQASHALVAQSLSEAVQRAVEATQPALGLHAHLRGDTRRIRGRTEECAMLQQL